MRFPKSDNVTDYLGSDCWKKCGATMFDCGTSCFSAVLMAPPGYGENTAQKLCLAKATTIVNLESGAAS